MLPLLTHAPSALHGPQVAVLYVQYAVVVFRLNIDYPSAITAVAAAASSLTWADALLGFSPACLAPGLGSGAQATAQLLGSLLIPCGAVAASLGLWALRCGTKAGAAEVQVLTPPLLTAPHAPFRSMHQHQL